MQDLENYKSEAREIVEHLGYSNIANESLVNGIAASLAEQEEMEVKRIELDNDYLKSISDAIEIIREKKNKHEANIIISMWKSLKIPPEEVLIIAKNIDKKEVINNG